MKLICSHSIVWLCVFACSVFGEETRLYSGTVQIPTLGELDMTLGVSETDGGTYLLLTVPTQGARNVPLPVSYTQDGLISAELPQAGLKFIVSEDEEFTKLSGEMHQGLFKMKSTGDVYEGIFKND